MTSKDEKNWKIRIEHMIKCAEETCIFTKNMTVEEFLDDLKTIRSVERSFTILGEAANRIPKDIQKQFPEVEWSDIIGFRHVITHDYDRTRDMILWLSIQNKVPDLLESLKKIRIAMEKQ